MQKMEGRDSRDILNSVLCDELLADILSKASNPLDCKSISLVCKRWQRVQRSAKCKLGLCMPNDASCAALFCVAVPSLLAQHPFITCLSIKSKWSMLGDRLVARIVTSIAASCKFLRKLHFTAAPISGCGLKELSQGCPSLCFLGILQPSSANCLPPLCSFTSLQELSIYGHDDDAMCADNKNAQHADDSFDVLSPMGRGESPPSGSLQIMKMSLINMRSCMSCDLRWLWRSSGKLQKLELSGCDRVGDVATMSAFAHALPFLQVLKLHRCRGIAGEVLAMVSKHTLALKSLTVHDGTGTEGLRLVLQKCTGLELLDLRLPLDLSREVLLHIGQHGKCLRTLRLHSCWMATGADMQTLVSNINSNLEELVLVRCRAIFQDAGTLSSIGQSLANLITVDLSENEYLVDKELAGMLAACQNVRNLNLWKCCRLTDKVVDFISRRCLHLESIDIRSCDAMSTQAVTSLLTECGHLKKVAVDPIKLSTAGRKMAFVKCIALVQVSCRVRETVGL